LPRSEKKTGRPGIVTREDRKEFNGERGKSTASLAR